METTASQPTVVALSLLFERVVVGTSPVILAFISTRYAYSLRLTSQLFVEVVTAHHWDDAVTPIGA